MERYKVINFTKNKKKLKNTTTTIKIKCKYNTIQYSTVQYKLILSISNLE